jgi:hypothetical protein
MRARRQSGSSALELVITVAVFAMVMSGLVGVLQSARSSSRQFEGVGGLDEKAWQDRGDRPERAGRRRGRSS